jgi:hypothetical protein
VIVAFTLSMPNNNAWNGRWSGEGNVYAIVRSFRGAIKFNVGESYYYNFGDGWGASVYAKAVTAGEAAKLRRKSKGFCGYDWMVDDIVRLGRIRTLAEKYPKKEQTPAPLPTEATP